MEITNVWIMYSLQINSQQMSLGRDKVTNSMEVGEANLRKAQVWSDAPLRPYTISSSQTIWFNLKQQTGRGFQSASRIRVWA